MARWLVLCLVASSACVESTTKLCGVVTCGENAVCSPAGDRCVAQVQIDACASVGDGAGCSYPGVPEGVCSAGVCGGAGCGNGIVDPNSEEVCDDGNRISLDGCRGDCLSDERCGDGVQDLILGELCDCGDGASAVLGCTMANSLAAGASCRPDCRPARCGDSVLDPGERCDDGNVVPGDGCRADCAGRWTEMDTGTFTDLFDVWGTGPNDVWAVGYRKLLHYDGTAWTATALPQPLASLVYTDVWGTASNNVYAVSGYRLDRWDGSVWTQARTLLGSPNIASSIWGASASDFWIGYEAGGQGALQRYTGPGAPADYNFLEVTELTGTSATNVIAVLFTYSNGDDYRLWRYDGVANLGGGIPAGWAPLTGTTSVDPLDALVARFVLAFADNNIFAYDAFAAAGPTMRHYNGSSWTSARCCDEMGGFAVDFGGVASDYIMVGDGGRITTSADAYNWVISHSPTTVNLNAVWSYAPDRAFIVGERGTILY